MSVLGGRGGGQALGGPVLTILFSDVVGSTELYVTRGNVAARAMIAVHDELARGAVENHGGRVVKGLGDGAMAVFMSPRAALAAAVTLQQALASHWGGGSTDSLEVRIGVNTGEVLEEGDGDVHGAAVAAAARVAAHAAGGQVLVTDMVARLTGTIPGLELRRLGPFLLKGFDAPVELHEVGWHAAPAAGLAIDVPPAAAPPRRAGRTELLGRSRELDDLERCMGDAVSGKGHLVLIQGEPGIGKTRLVEELSGRASSAGVAVAWGRCVEDTGAPPYWPWRQVLAALGVDAAELVDAGGGGPEERFLVFEQIVERLRGATSASGAVLVFDDLHWADHTSLLLLVHLMRAIPAPPALVIGTFRSTEPGDLPTVLADLTRSGGARRIELAGLGVDDVQRHLVLVSGQEVTEVAARQVTDATAGNPFFVGEIARTLRGGSWSGILPASVRDVIRHRIDRLTPACGAVLRAASVVGRDFAAATIAAMTGTGLDESMTLLDEATTAGVVEPGRIAGEHRFAHALTLEAMEADIPSARRLELHLAAARAIEVLYAGRLDPHLADLARHWVAAAPAGHSAVAAGWAERAGDAAVRALAYEEAIRHFGAALDVGAAALAPLDRCRLHLALARACYLAGELAKCADACFAAAALARSAERSDLLAEAALVLEALGEPDLNARIYALCAEALERLEATGGHDALRARLLAQLSHLSLYRGEHERVDALSREALDLARRAGEDTALVAALRSRQEALSGPDGREERRELPELMLAAGQRLRSARVSMWGHLWRIDALMEQGQLSAGRAELDHLAEQVERVGGPLPRWHLARCRAAIAQSQGRLGEAHAAGLEGYRIMEAVDPLEARRVYTAVLAALGHHARLREDQVAHFRGAADDVSPFRTVSALWKAIGLLDAGRPDEARVIFTRVGPPSEWPLPPYLRVVGLAVGLLVAGRLGARNEAVFLHEELSTYRGLHCVAGAGKVNYWGPVELPLGIGALFLGRLDEAAADLEFALERSSEAGAPGCAIEAACELAHTMTQRAAPGDRHRASELLARAVRDAESLGMDLLVDRARAIGPKIDN